MQQKNLITIIIVVIVVGVGGFFGGMKYQQNQTSQGDRSGNGQFQRQGGQNFRPVSGQIVSVDNTGITIKMRDGSSKIVIIPNSASISKPTEASKSALKTGEQVMVMGKSNSDGSVTAQIVQLNPVSRNQNNTAQ